MDSSIRSPLFSMPLARSVTEPPLQSCSGGWGVGGDPQRKEDNEQKLTMSQHTLCLYNVSNSGKDMPNFHVETARGEAF